MVNESRNKLSYQEISIFNTDSKRVRKLTEKLETPISSFMDQTSAFDVDAVMNLAGSSSRQHSVVSTKKLLTKRVRKISQRPKRIETS